MKNTTFAKKVASTENIKKNRLVKIEGWLGKGSRPASSNVVNIIENGDTLKKIEVIDADLRQVVLNVPARFQSRMNDLLQREAKLHNSMVRQIRSAGTWSKAIVRGELEAFYASLAHHMGIEASPLVQAKNIKMSALFDVMMTHELGLEFTGGHKVASPMELQMFMNGLLAERNISHLAKKAYSSAETVNRLAKEPDAVTLTTLMRVLKALDIRPTVYDARLEHANKHDGFANAVTRNRGRKKAATPQVDPQSPQNGYRGPRM